MTTRRTRESVSRSARRLVVSSLVALAVVPPLLTGGAGLALAWRDVGRDLARIDWLLSRQPPLPAELEGLLALPPWQPETTRRELHRADGEIVVATAGDRALPGPVLDRGRRLLRPVSTWNGPATTLVVRVSLRPLLDLTLLVALASTLAALVLWGWAFMRRVSALAVAEARLRSAASSDPLTGLLNREALRTRLGRALERLRDSSADTRRAVGLLVIDVDRFGLVNGTLGQPAGDALLRHVGNRLVATIRDSDLVARLGADQFAILVERVSGTPPLAAMARNLLRAFERPYRLDGHETVVTLSIGLTVSTPGRDTIDAMLGAADAAMRVAKQGGGGRFRIYEPTMAVDSTDRLEMDVRLHRALANNEFFLMYQPVVDARGERITAVEALARWADPARGLISPAEFIPVLEQTGMIVPVGRRLLYEACRTAAGWLRDGPEPTADLTISVNASPRQFAEPDFVNTVLDALELTGLPARHLQIEVTEGLLLDPAADAVAKIDALAGAGVQLAVDDFGMGYSSLAYLKRFRLHALKIDRMLLREVATEPQDAAIVKAIVELGRGLGLKVVAEGVETRAQFAVLRALGCDAMQGFLFSLPLAADRARDHLVNGLPLVGQPEPDEPSPAVAPSVLPGLVAAGTVAPTSGQTLFTN